MGINEQLRDVASIIISRRGEGIRSLFDAQIAAAAEHLLQAHVPKVGDAAPNFSLTAIDGRIGSADRDAFSGAGRSHLLSGQSV